jgi:uridylate kinase
METQHDSGGGRIRPPFRFETPNFDLFITTNRFLQKERSAMTASTGPRYKRVLLKLSGESFARPGESGISVSEVQVICEQIKRVVESGVQLAIVCGGGNILRGREFSSTNSIVAPATAHYMGMLATAINALALQDVMEHFGIPTRVQSAIPIPPVAEPFIRRRCIRHLEKGRVVILAAGTGSPFVTTDTAAALRAREIDADLVVKATRVDGIYSDDPLKNPHAVRYSELTYQDVLRQNLQVMDAQAIHHCMEHNIPIVVLNYQKPGNIERAIAGERLGTRVGPSI